MKILTLPINWILVISIRVYQKTKMRRYSKCLHYPSCSEYGIIALKKYNLFKAVKLTIKRYNDCNPFSNRPYIDYP
ncbi:membrane protein insertion efficiency factor YidD [Parasediminibacterium paludis]|uniref:Membrane protein insertion efficiency factor YidD n=1 Tax=Parasediminibacterium paludis TaxID=908966 RepID=A0ABV8PWW0_9BACT